MKNILIVVIALAFSVQSGAQTWKAHVEKLSGSGRSKTIGIKAGHNLTIASLLIRNDTLLMSRYYEGSFIKGTGDSVLMTLFNVKETKSYPGSGITETVKIPARYYLRDMAPDTSLLKVALPDIAFLESRNQKISGWAEMAEPVILLSILNMVAAPFICYNYGEGNFNADRYRYFAVASSIGMAAGLATAFTFSGLSRHHKLQFREGWPDKKAKVWKFN